MKCSELSCIELSYYVISENLFVESVIILYQVFKASMVLNRRVKNGFLFRFSASFIISTLSSVNSNKFSDDCAKMSQVLLPPAQMNSHTIHYR